MYFDPPERSKLSTKPPVLSAAEIRTEEERFLAEVQRELIIRGDSSKTIAALVGEMRPRLTVAARLGPSHETSYRSRHGGLLNAKAAAQAIVEEARERDHLSAYGPDPAALLRDRLIALGLPEAEARARAAGRVKRLEDGRVIARDADGKLLYSGPGPAPGKKYTDAEKSVFADAGHAVRIATRAILEEWETGVAAAPVRSPEQSLDDIRSRVAGVL